MSDASVIIDEATGAIQVVVDDTSAAGAYSAQAKAYAELAFAYKNAALAAQQAAEACAAQAAAQAGDAESSAELASAAAQASESASRLADAARVAAGTARDAAQAAATAAAEDAGLAHEYVQDAEESKNAAALSATAAATSARSAAEAATAASAAQRGAEAARAQAERAAELAEDAAEKVSTAKYVSPSGDDNNNGNSPQSAYASLSKALSTGVKNIYIARGTYTEPDPNAETWNPKYTGAEVNIVADDATLVVSKSLYFRYARNVRISGLKISVDPAAQANASGMLLLNCSGAYLSNCAVSGAPYMGFRLDGTKAVLENCVAHDCGIDGFNAHRVTEGYEPEVSFINCTAFNNGDDGASVHETGKMTVVGGAFYNNGQAGIAVANFCVFSIDGADCHNNGRSGIEAINDNLNGAAPASGSIVNAWLHDNPYGFAAKNYNVSVARNVFSRNTCADVLAREGAAVSTQGYSLESLAHYPTDTVSGAPAAITDGADGIPVKRLSVQITPAQAGSGDPAPDNVRPISGRTGLQLCVSPTADAQDGDTYALSWESEAGIVYGGTLDVTAGLLTVNRVSKVFDGSENGWTINSIYGVAYDIRGIGSGIDLTRLPIADYLTTLPQGAGSGLAAWQCRYSPSGAYFLVRGDAAATASVAAWKAYLAEHPLTVLFGLSSPVTYQIAPNAVRTRLGVNNVWTDCGPVEVEYRADPTIVVYALKAQISAQEEALDTKVTASDTGIITITDGLIARNANGVVTLDFKAPYKAVDATAGSYKTLGGQLPEGLRPLAKVQFPVSIDGKFAMLVLNSDSAAMQQLAGFDTTSSMELRGTITYTV